MYKKIWPSSISFKPADIHDCCVTDHQTSSLLFLSILLLNIAIIFIVIFIDTQDVGEDDEEEVDLVAQIHGERMTAVRVGRVRILLSNLILKTPENVTFEDAALPRGKI